MQDYNDSIKFENDLVKILKDYISDKLFDFLQFCVDTHNLTPIFEIIEIINKNEYKDKGEKMERDYIPRFRTIQQCLVMIKELDEESAISE